MDMCYRSGILFILKIHDRVLISCLLFSKIALVQNRDFSNFTNHLKQSNVSRDDLLENLKIEQNFELYDSLCLYFNVNDHDGDWLSHFRAGCKFEFLDSVTWLFCQKADGAYPSGTGQKRSPLHS